MGRKIGQSQRSLFPYLGLKEPDVVWGRERYLRYRRIWQRLYVGTLKRSFRLEFPKKYKFERPKELFPTQDVFDIDRAMGITRKREWRKNPHNKQHWGHWLHSIAPYQGRLTPSFAHWLVRIFSVPGMVVLDPFCGCYDSQTEILTERGFVLFKDMRQSDRVASLVDDHLQFVKPLRYFKYEYDGEMYHIKARSVDLLITPNHNLYFKEIHQSAFQLAPVSEITYESLNLKSNCEWDGEHVEWFYLPAVTVKTNKRGTRELEAVKIKMDDWLEFLGYYLTEGSTTYYHRGECAGNVQIRQTDGKKKDRMRDLLDRLPFQYHEYRNRFRIYDFQLFSYLIQFGKAKDKFIPAEVKRLSKKQLKNLFDALMLGDGSYASGDVRYYTSSPKLQDDFCELVLKLGFSPSVFTREPRSHPINELRNGKSEERVIKEEQFTEN